MKKIFTAAVLVCSLIIGILGCSSDDSGGSVDYVEDTASLMRHMTIPGAVLKNGDIPVPSGSLADNITSIPNTVIVTSNSLFTIPISTNSSSGRLPKMIFIKLEGSDKYYEIELNENGDIVNSRNSNVNQRILSCTGNDIRLNAQGVNPNSYENNAQVYVYSPPVQSFQDLSFLSQPQCWSTPRTIKFKALDVGTGDVQVSLTWDTQSDVDLWLTEPNGNKIYYANSTSSTGGELDFDNTVEYGPENIFYKNSAPSGTYKVEVDYFSGAPQVTNYNVVVKNGSSVTVYQGTLSNYDQTNLVTTFTK